MFVVDFEHVAGEVLQVLETQGQDVLAGIAQRVFQGLAFMGVGQGIEAGDGELAAYIHHYVAVVDRRLLAINGMEQAQAIVQLFGELAQRGLMGAVGVAGIADPVFAVQNHAASALKEQILLLQRA
ncbi:hypothetical protein D3C76_1192730 [compost metagenome]